MYAHAYESMNALLGMFDPFARILHEPACEPACLLLLYAMKPVHQLLRPDKLVQQAAYVAKPLPIRRQNQRLGPPHHLACHYQRWAVRIVCAAFLEQSDGVFEAVQDDDALTENVD